MMEKRAEERVVDDVYDVCIVGAGMAGLACAHEWARHGGGGSGGGVSGADASGSGVHRVLVVDKSGGVGGRMATRRVALDEGETSAWGRADHGAQFISAHGEVFRRAWLAPWLAGGYLREWFGSSENKPRYLAPNGMNNLMKIWQQSLVNKIEFRMNCAIIRIERDEMGWLLVSETGAIRARAVVVTAPIPQALAVIDQALIDLIREADERQAWTGDRLLAAFAALDRLKQVRYDRCLALILSLGGPSDVPEPGFCRTDLLAPLSWIADNRMKELYSGNRSVLTVHLDGQWSQDHYAWKDKEIATFVMPLLQTWIGSAKVREVQVKRWRYALSKQLYPAACADVGAMFGCKHRLILAGDGFSCLPDHPQDEQGRVETAYLSGVAAAHSLLQLS